MNVSHEAVGGLSRAVYAMLTYFVCVKSKTKQKKKPSAVWVRGDLREAMFIILLIVLWFITAAI